MAQMPLYKNIIVRSLPYHYRSAILLHYNRPCPPLTAWYLNHFSLTSLVLLQEKSTEGRGDMDPKGRQNFWYMQITPILPIILFYLGQNIETFHSGVLAILESCETDILEKCGNPLTGYFIIYNCQKQSITIPPSTFFATRKETFSKGSGL